MKKGLAFITVLVLAFSVLILPARAVYDDGQGTRVGIRIESCKLATCSSGDWYNYSEDEGGDGETLVVSPGDTVTIRTLEWADFEWDEVTPYMGLAFTNSSYFDILDIYGPSSSYDDVDGNTVRFETVGADWTTGLFLDPLYSTSDVDNKEEGWIKIRIKDDAPDQTLIVATFTLTEVLTPQPQMTFDLIPVAQAQEEALSESTTRILVSNPAAEELPETGAAVGPGVSDGNSGAESTAASAGAMSTWMVLLITGAFAGAFVGLRRIGKKS